MDTPLHPADGRPPERPPAEVRTAESMQEFNVDRAMNTPGFVAFLGTVENAADMDMTDANKDEIKEHFDNFQTQKKVDRMLRRPGFNDFLDAHDDKDTFNRKSFENAEELEARLQTFEKCKAVSRDLRAVFAQKLAAEKTGKLTAEEVKGFDKYVYGEASQSPERLAELAKELEAFKQFPQVIAGTEAELKRLALEKTKLETGKVSLEKKKERAKQKKEERVAQLEKSMWARMKSKVFGTGLPKMEADIQKLDADIAEAQTLLVGHPEEADVQRGAEAVRAHIEELKQKMFAEIPLAERIHKRIASEFDKQMESALTSNSLTSIQTAAAKFAHFETLAEKEGDASNYLDFGGAAPFDREKFREDIEAKVKELVSAGIMKTLGELPAGSTQRRLETALRTYTRMAEKGFGLSGPEESKELVLTFLQEHEQTLKKQKGGLEKAILARRLIAKLEGAPDTAAAPPVISTVHRAPASATATAGPERAPAGTAVVTPTERPTRTASARTVEKAGETSGFTLEQTNYHKVGDMVMWKDRYTDDNKWDAPKRILSFSSGEGGRLFANVDDGGESVGVRVDLLVEGEILPTVEVNDIDAVQFKEVVHFGSQALREIIKEDEITVTIVATALLDQNEDARSLVLGAISRKASDTVRKELDGLKGVTLKQVSDAQERIVSVAKKLAKENKLPSVTERKSATATTRPAPSPAGAPPSAPAPARAETAPSTPRVPEQPPKQETLKLLAYQDAQLSPADKKATLEAIGSSESAQNYARALDALVAREGLDAVKALASEMVRDMKKVLSRVGIPVSPHGESKSWALWDIGKQEYFVQHPDKADPRYTVASAFSDSTKMNEVINRQIGWEVYGGFRSGTFAPVDFFEKIRSENQPEIRSLLSEDANDHDSLSSLKLARLGALVRGDVTGLSAEQLPPVPPAEPENPTGSSPVPENISSPGGIDTPLPDWLQTNFDQAYVTAEQKGVVEAIEKLCAERLTAKQITERLKLDNETIVKAVRFKRGIPSMTVGAGASQSPNPEFEQWLKSYTATKAPGGRTTEKVSTERAETGPKKKLEDVTFADLQPLTPEQWLKITERLTPTAIAEAFLNKPELLAKIRPLMDSGTALQVTSEINAMGSGRDLLAIQIGEKFALFEARALAFDGTITIPNVEVPKKTESSEASGGSTLSGQEARSVSESPSSSSETPEMRYYTELKETNPSPAFLGHVRSIFDSVYREREDEWDSTFIREINARVELLKGLIPDTASYFLKTAQLLDDIRVCRLDEGASAREGEKFGKFINLAYKLLNIIQRTDANIPQCIRGYDALSTFVSALDKNSETQQVTIEGSSLMVAERQLEKSGIVFENTSGATAETGSHTPEQIELKTFTDLEKLPDADLERVVKMGAAPYIWGYVVQDLPGSEVSESFVAKVRQFVRDQGAFDRGKASVQSGERIRRDREYTVEDARKQLSPKPPEENAS